MISKEKKAQYDIKYRQEHYKRIVLDIPPELKDRWTDAAKKANKSLSKYIRDAVNASLGDGRGGTDG